MKDDPGSHSQPHPPASANRILPPAIEAKNLVVNRQSLYQPVLAHRHQMEELKTHRIKVSQGQRIEGKIWTEQNDAQSNNSISLPSITEIQDLLPSHQHERTQDLEASTIRFFQVQALLHGFYGAKRIKAMDWSLKKARKAELDLAIDTILKECPKKTFFCYGNGSFRTGINLASPHEAFKALFAQKVKASFSFYVNVFSFVSVRSDTQQKENAVHLYFVYDYGNRPWQPATSLFWWTSSSPQACALHVWKLGMRPGWQSPPCGPVYVLNVADGCTAT